MPKPASPPVVPGRLAGAAQVEVDVFVEGATEERVLTTLRQRQILQRRCSVRWSSRGNDLKGEATGKEALLQHVRLQLQEWLKLPGAGRSPLQVLLMLDQDDASEAAVVQQVHGALAALLPEGAALKPVLATGRAYSLESSIGDLRLALCIAGNPAICDVFPALSRRAMDDDVLLLALQEETAAGMLAARHESRRVLGVDRLLSKVKTEIPSLLAQNGLPPFVYAKDHIRFYAALLGISLSPATFAGTVVQHAPAAELQRVFAPLLAAFAAL